MTSSGFEDAVQKKKKNEMNFIFEIQRQIVMHQQMQHVSNTDAAFQVRPELPLNAKTPHLQGQAVVCGGFVFAAVVLAVVDVNMVQLQKAHQISGCLRKKTHGDELELQPCAGLKSYVWSFPEARRLN